MAFHDQHIFDMSLYDATRDYGDDVMAVEPMDRSGSNDNNLGGQVVPLSSGRVSPFSVGDAVPYLGPPLLDAYDSGRIFSREEVPAFSGEDMPAFSGEDTPAFSGGDMSAFPGGDVSTFSGGDMDMSAFPGGDMSAFPSGDMSTISGWDMPALTSGQEPKFSGGYVPEHNLTTYQTRYPPIQNQQDPISYHPAKLYGPQTQTGPLQQPGRLIGQPIHQYPAQFAFQMPDYQPPGQFPFLPYDNQQFVGYPVDMGDPASQISVPTSQPVLKRKRHEPVPLRRPVNPLQLQKPLLNGPLSRVVDLPSLKKPGRKPKAQDPNPDPDLDTVADPDTVVGSQPTTHRKAQNRESQARHRLKTRNKVDELQADLAEQRRTFEERIEDLTRQVRRQTTEVLSHAQVVERLQEEVTRLKKENHQLRLEKSPFSQLEDAPTPADQRSEYQQMETDFTYALAPKGHKRIKVVANDSSGDESIRNESSGKNASGNNSSGNNFSGNHSSGRVPGDRHTFTDDFQLIDSCGFCTDQDNCACKAPVLPPLQMPAISRHNSTASMTLDPPTRASGPGSCDMCIADPAKARQCQELAATTRFNAPDSMAPPPPRPATQRMSCRDVVGHLGQFSRQGRAHMQDAFGRLRAYPYARDWYDVDRTPAMELDAAEAAEALTMLAQIPAQGVAEVLTMLAQIPGQEGAHGSASINPHMNANANANVNTGIGTILDVNIQTNTEDDAAAHDDDVASRAAEAADASVNGTMTQSQMDENDQWFAKLE